LIASKLWVLVLPPLTRFLFSHPVNTRKEINMGAVKKAYQDYCDKNDINPDDSEAQAMQDFEHIAWRKEFEDWLDDLAKKYSRDEGDNDD